MTASSIRQGFVEFFTARGHEPVASSSLVPSDDPTLLFTNAGMVQFKGVFQGAEETAWPRAVTAQKCVRAGGKHNDLEEVGVTARHHTFFEMLGNFSFGDYFKREAIGYAWELLTGEYGLEPDRIFATVHHTDDEAHGLWQEVAGLDPARIFRLGDEDNFWQMADTGPCGPCSELHYDRRPDGDRSLLTTEAFCALGDAGEIVELWNLVFMQFDRDAAGVARPLPSPSIDTGLGLERMAAVLQGVASNYHTDLFRPLLDRVGDVVGRGYHAGDPESLSYRVLADHARAVAFLLADGVFPSSEGRGYVLRRILRRAVRHAWLLGLREPALVEVVGEVIRCMAGTYPELAGRGESILRTTRSEEERFLLTIEAGMERFDRIAPVCPQVRVDAVAGAVDGRLAGPGVIDGAEAFRLYDTYGFPLDLTQVMARERGYEVDGEGFRAALEGQRAQSRADRKRAVDASVLVPDLDMWTVLDPLREQEWVGWETTCAETRILALTGDTGRVGLVLAENPFYVEAGGQVSDTGRVMGEGWMLQVDEIGRVAGRTAVAGQLEGEFTMPVPARTFRAGIRVTAEVAPAVRHDTERNHTATHLLHAALRRIMGDHVAQRGSLVDPGRLRFDFSHPQPLTKDEIRAVEREVNGGIWADHPVRWEITTKEDALERGAMALFGEKYGAEVRIVEIPGVSIELCGGTHLRHTGEAGLFVIVREAGVAAGVRRIEALTGRAAFAHLRRAERELERISARVRVPRERVSRRIEELLGERAELEELLAELRRGGGGTGTPVHQAELPSPDGGRVTYRALRLRVKDARDARAYGDAFRERESAALLALASETPDGRITLFVFVTDDLIRIGVSAGSMVREIAALAGGRGGGRPHMAQGGIGDPNRLEAALLGGEAVLSRVLEGGSR